MEAIDKKDILNLSTDPFVKSILSQNEEIYLSSLIIKYNRYGFKQERKIIVTNLHLFNVSKQKINRKIDLLKVDAVTLSRDPKSSEFIIHVSDEYDYRYTNNQFYINGKFNLLYLSQSYSDLIAQQIRKIVKLKGHSIKFYRVPQTKLKQYATNKKEVALGKFRRPDAAYQVPDEIMAQSIPQVVAPVQVAAAQAQVKQEQPSHAEHQEHKQLAIRLSSQINFTQ